MQQRTWIRFTLAVAIAATIGACGRSGDMDSDGMADGMAMPMAPTEYTIVLKGSWTAANFPREYPTANAITGPHFSGLIGASHDTTYALFTEGTMPTPGLERLSEEGRHNPLDDEIRAAITAGGVGVLFESGPLRDFGDSLVAVVRVDSAHPMVSLVAMIAPSPDWFAGFLNVTLMENGAWVTSRTVELTAWDSGGDDGTTYKAADRDTNPKRVTSRNMSPHFVVDGTARPVGVVTISRRQ